MIQRTIEVLLKSKIFDMIIVSSDSNKIQNISRKAGAKILFTRPKNLSNDFVGTFEVINHLKKLIFFQNMYAVFIQHQ